MPPQNYEIRIRGHLGETYRAAFSGLHMRTQDNATVLSGRLADRAALYGLLTMIETLALELVELRQVRHPDLVSRVLRAGELQVSGTNQDELDSYFDQEKFRFHGPGGFETGYAGLGTWLTAMRAAFDDRKISQVSVLAEGNTVACQAWLEGTVARELAGSLAGWLAPTGERIVIDLISIFRFDDDGHLVEEFVRADYPGRSRQPGGGG